MKQELELDFLGGMAFEAEMNGHKVYIDADESVGGKNSAPPPKAMMMLALAGCTGMDVVSILKKMRVEFDALTVKIEAELDDEFPKPYTAMKVIFNFSGENLPLDKIQKAVDLSKDRYCGVSANYKDSFPVTHEIVLNK
jgi:putative redox protein